MLLRFLHLPKTGGSSLKLACKDRFGARAIQDYGNNRHPALVDVDPEAVWPSVHRAVDNDHVVDAVQTPGDGRIVLFSMPTIHKAQATVRRGWRWWMRASMYYARPINKIRRQVQVYTSSEGAGW